MLISGIADPIEVALKELGTDVEVAAVSSKSPRALSAVFLL
jgi:hypothetical protein